jgi:riboflavin synthase
MFTGIIEETGIIETIDPQATSIRLAVRAALTASDIHLGDSLAVNGCCLTVVGITNHKNPSEEKLLEFDLLKETWHRTNFQFAHPGSLVNLERSLPVNGRLHGHFVMGHIDSLGIIKAFERRGPDYFLQINTPTELERYLVFKGSVAVDGISLTVSEVHEASFGIWIIPHTYEVTALKERAPGQAVNLEADVLAKYAERLLQR